MDFNPSEEQQALHETVRDLFERESPTPAVRAAEPDGFDEGLWRRVVEMGLPSIAVDERLGGGGAGMTELALVAENVGRYLAPIPFVESAVAGTILSALAVSGSSAVDSLVRRVTSGEALATVALQPVQGSTARAVPAGAVANIVIARHDSSLVVDETPAPGAALPNLGAMAIAHRDLSDRAMVIAVDDEAIALHRQAIRLWQQLTAVALIGLGRRALEITCDYVQERRAFGVRIASFQAIQHALADDVSLLEGARLLAYEAAWAYDNGMERANELALMAFLYAWESAVKTTTDALHFHGGYGFSLEYDIQLYLRRAKGWPLVCGDPVALYSELGRNFSSAPKD